MTTNPNHTPSSNTDTGLSSDRVTGSGTGSGDGRRAGRVRGNATLHARRQAEAALAELEKQEASRLAWEQADRRSRLADLARHHTAFTDAQARADHAEAQWLEQLLDVLAHGATPVQAAAVLALPTATVKAARTRAAPLRKDRDRQAEFGTEHR